MRFVSSALRRELLSQPIKGGIAGSGVNIERTRPDDWIRRAAHDRPIGRWPQRRTAFKDEACRGHQPPNRQRVGSRDTRGKGGRRDNAFGYTHIVEGTYLIPPGCQRAELDD